MDKSTWQLPAPTHLPLPGGDAQGVFALRSRDDASAIAERMALCIEKQLPVIVIGGGFIGLKVAATARKKGLSTTVLEAAPRLLGRVLAPMLSNWYADLHRSHGAALVLDARIAAGLECDRGIVVDACGRTSDPAIVAAGDCTARRLADDSLLRLESVQNATEQGKSAAAALLGLEKPFTATPWFWSDQYDKKLQMAGLSMGADQWAVRGDMAAGSFSVYHFKGEQLLAVDSVNASKDHLLARKLLDAGVSPTVAQAMDLGVDLAGLLLR